MDTIFFSDLSVSGIHGVTPSERKKPQKFLVDVTVNKIEGGYSEKIENTYDYRVARQIVEEVFRGPHKFLIETLAEEISAKILKSFTNLYSAEVKIRKPEIWQNGLPGVSIKRFSLPSSINLIDFNIEEAVDRLVHYGGVSFPILGEDRRKELARDALKYEYKEAQKTFKNVYEEFDVVREFPEGSPFFKLKEDFEKILWLKFSTFGSPFFNQPLLFNELLLQKYKKGSVGITPHKDGVSYRNLIAIFVLKGKGKFALCGDRSGSNPRYLETMPGNVILLSAPGFMGTSFQPMHFLKDIEKERIIFSLRQKLT